jgi:hypothetical protein
LGAAAQAGPAHLLQWSRELAEEVMDQMAESIVDLAHKLEESEARVAVLEEEQKILKRERHIAINGETIEEWDHWRTAGECEQWRECAEKLADALRLCDESVLPRHPASRASEVIVQAWNEFLRMRQEFAGVIEGGTNIAVPSPSGGHGCPSDLSPRTTLSDEELAEEVRHKYEADRVGGHEWGNI